MQRSPDQAQLAAPSARGRVEGDERLGLTEGWRAACAAPELEIGLARLDELDWLPARVPGTAAGALRDAGLWRAGEPRDLDAEEWWFRCDFASRDLAAGEEALLRMKGIATVSEVYLNGEPILTSESMFAAHAIDVSELLRPHNELVVRCLALAPLLAIRRKPRARWRTRLVTDGNLRFFRTMLLGRTHGTTSGPAAVGPWRGVSLERRRSLAVERLTLRPRLEGEHGVLGAQIQLRTIGAPPPSAVELELRGPSGTHRLALSVAPASGDEEDLSLLRAAGELRVPGVARWWPHTHGEPALHEVSLLLDGERRLRIDAGRVGFRELAPGAGAAHDVERDGLDLHVNGTRVFARGALWTGLDAIGLAPSESELREELLRVRAAGMNMLRLPGTSAYETSVFHDLCDELGILVWQDFMFANLDYPFALDEFRAAVEREAKALLDELAGRPSVVVVCGNSEVEQQVAMLGLEPSLGRGDVFGEALPTLLRESGLDAIYLPSAPCGEGLPFRADRGVANYFGVGGYRRPLEDARRAGVLFAAECLAFSNVPDDAGIEQALPGDPQEPLDRERAWKAGVPRDAGADWDFEDVRDHYLASLFGLDARALREADHDRYIELSRALTGEVIAEVFGEWRRAASPCNGGLVLWLRDRAPGAGWGLLDHGGEPKLAYHYLRRALAPVAVWTVDEGMNGVVAHVANDMPARLDATLRVSLYADLQHRVEQTLVPVALEPHSQDEWNVETVIGRFVDASWAYRFGPPAQDAIVVSLLGNEEGGAGAGSLLSQAVRFPAGYPLARETPERLGIEAVARPLADGSMRLALTSARLLYGVRIHTPGFRPADDGFSLEPGVERAVTLHPRAPESTFAAGRLSALNMHGQIDIEHHD